MMKTPYKYPCRLSQAPFQPFYEQNSINLPPKSLNPLKNPKKALVEKFRQSPPLGLVLLIVKNSNHWKKSLTSRAKSRIMIRSQHLVQPVIPFCLRRKWTGSCRRQSRGGTTTAPIGGTGNKTFLKEVQGSPLRTDLLASLSPYTYEPT